MYSRGSDSTSTEAEAVVRPQRELMKGASGILPTSLHVQHLDFLQLLQRGRFASHGSQEGFSSGCRGFSLISVFHNRLHGAKNGQHLLR